MATPARRPEANLSEIFVSMQGEGARLVAEAAPGAPLFLQPITSVDDSRWEIDQGQLGALVAVASAALPTTRMLPQLRKLVGIR